MASLYAIDDIVRITEDLESKDGKKKLPKDSEGKITKLCPKSIYEIDFGSKITPKIWIVPEEYLRWIKHDYTYESNSDRDGDDYYNEWGGGNYSRGGYYNVKKTRVKAWNGTAYETKIL